MAAKSRAQRMTPPKAAVPCLRGFVIVWLIMAAFPFLWTLWGIVQGRRLDFFSIADWTNALDGMNVPKSAIPAAHSQVPGYYGAWVQEEFLADNVINTFIVVVFFVVDSRSLTIGTLGGYALARGQGTNILSVILITALIFRAMPPITLVVRAICCRSLNGTFGASCRRRLSFWWQSTSRSPFGCCIQFLSERSPRNMDESAKVDGCTQFQAFRHVIIPVMWPGVITTGLFSFLLAYNDFRRHLRCCCRGRTETMVPADRKPSWARR